MLFRAQTSSWPLWSGRAPIGIGGCTNASKGQHECRAVNQTWQGWQSGDEDTISKIAEPGFQGNVSAGHFALRPDSPAVALGFDAAASGARIRVGPRPPFVKDWRKECEEAEGKGGGEFSCGPPPTVANSKLSGATYGCGDVAVAVCLVHVVLHV